jgi:hypothetical protein
MAIRMLVGAAAMLPFARDVRPATVVPPALLALLAERFRDRVSLHAAAAAYFSRYPAEFDLMRLCRLLLRDVNPHADLVAQLNHNTVCDFAAGDIVVLDGWVLARSEARLIAAASLVPLDA